jgi:Tol biopolymer transport system component
VLSAAVVSIAGGAASGRAGSPSLIVFSADRAPQLSGEIYRVDPNGHRVNLSRSPAYRDVDPVVSPDGKRVAFLSDRSGRLGVYEVGIGGRGLVRVARSARLSYVNWPGDEGAELSWQPHGGRLAVASAGHNHDVWIVRPGHRSVHVRSINRIDGWSAVDGRVHGWSPDGRVLLVSVDGVDANPDRELGLSASGQTLWTIRKVVGASGSWSAHGLLAITTGSDAAGARHGIAVYDEARHLRFKVRFGVPDTRAYWSPDGSRLALASGRTLQVRTATGRLLLRKELKGLEQDLSLGSVAWDGNSHVVVFGYPDSPYPKIVDIRTGKTRTAPYRWSDPTSLDGKLAILTVPSGSVFWIQVARTAGGPPRTYTVVPGCDEDAVWHGDAGQFQFVPGGRSIIYTSICFSPLRHLYSVAADGGSVQRITTTLSDDIQPALSRDGSEIAYSRSPCAGVFCQASSGIHVINVGGSGEHGITNQACGRYGTTWPNGDVAPTWSPDGTTILFSRRDCRDSHELHTVPASGGALQDLGIAGDEPAWGPSRIAYVDSNSPHRVWTANPDGSGPVRVGDGFSPAWSGDGRLAYLTYPNGTTRGAILVADSTRAALPFASVSSLNWSPDGTRLIVTARAKTTAPSDVYTVKPDGTDLVRLTTNYGASGASW